MDAREQFAANLRQRREAAGISQEALGHACGLHRTEVSLLGIDSGLGQNEAVARIDNALDRATELARQLVTIGHIARLS